MSTADEPTTEGAPETAPSTAAEVESTAVEETSSAQTGSAETVATAPKPTPSAQPRWSREQWRAVGVSAAFVAVFGLVAGLGWQLWQQHRVSAASAAGQRAAAAYAEVLTSIDSEKVDDDFANVLNGATGEFKDTYSKASVSLRQLLIDNKATAQGTVVESAVQSSTTDTVVVLVMVDQKVTNTTRPDPRVDRSRMKLTMEEVDGRWLASKVELP